MLPARHVALALTTASLIMPAGALAQGAGGAGDDQYTDPFAGQGSSSSSGGSGNNGSSNNGNGNNSSSSGGNNGLSQNPGLSNGGNSTSTTGTSTTGTSSTTSTSKSNLANTGTDLRLMILAGLTLVLAGYGLRLRTADEKF